MFKRRITLSGFLILNFLFVFGTAGAEEFPVIVEAEEQAVISAEREGVLTALKVNTGDAVRRNGLMAVVYHQDLVLRKELYQANTEYLKTKVENISRLSEKGLSTDEELALARKELAVNGKEINIIESEISRSLIHAPFSGIIINREVQPHEWVKPGQPVVEMYDPNELRIVADIPSEIAVNMKKGQTDVLFFPALKREVTAELKVFTPHVDVRSNTIKIYWSVQETDDLLPGMKGVLKLGKQ